MATLVGAAFVVATGVLRAQADDDGGAAYTAGEIVGATLSAVLIAALVVFVVFRIADLDRAWMVPVVLIAAGTLSVVLLLARAGNVIRERTACEGAPAVRARSVAPGPPYRVRGLPASEAGKLREQAPVEGAEFDATRIVDTRDGAAFLVTALTSTREGFSEADLFSGFASSSETVEETTMGGRPARLTRKEGRTVILAGNGECTGIALYGVADRPTRALADELRISAP